MFNNETEMKWDDVEPETKPVEATTDTIDGDNVRLILIQLAEAGEIPQSVKYIEKANSKVIRKIYAKYQMKEQEKNNAVLTDVLITKFSELMGCTKHSSIWRTISSRTQRRQTTTEGYQKSCWIYSAIHPIHWSYYWRCYIGKTCYATTT